MRPRHRQNAEVAYRNAIALQTRLAGQSPRPGSYTSDLAISYNNLGMLESRDAKFAAAEKSFRQAVALQNQLLEVMPHDPATLSNLGGVYNNLGLLFDTGRRYTDAEANYRQAIARQKQALELSPASSRYRELLSNHFANYAKCLESQQKQQAAEQVTAERDSLLATLRSRQPAIPKN